MPMAVLVIVLVVGGSDVPRSTRTPPPPPPRVSKTHWCDSNHSEATSLAPDARRRKQVPDALQRQHLDHHLHFVVVLLVLVVFQPDYELWNRKSERKQQQQHEDYHLDLLLQHDVVCLLLLVLLMIHHLLKISRLVRLNLAFGLPKRRKKRLDPMT